MVLIAEIDNFFNSPVKKPTINGPKISNKNSVKGIERERIIEINQSITIIRFNVRNKQSPKPRK